MSSTEQIGQGPGEGRGGEGRGGEGRGGEGRGGEGRGGEGEGRGRGCKSEFRVHKPGWDFTNDQVKVIQL